MKVHPLFISIIKYSIAGSVVYAALLFATKFLGFNPLGREYSPLQAVFVPFVAGACIAHFFYIEKGKVRLLELGIFGLGVAFCSSLLYSVLFFFFLETNPALVKDYIEEAQTFLEENREVYIRFSGEEEYETARANLEKTSNGTILMDDLLKKLLIGFPFTILFLLLFFAMPNYFRKKNDDGKK